jgi:hypothetical protein
MLLISDVVTAGSCSGGVIGVFTASPFLQEYKNMAVVNNKPGN